MNTTKAQEIVGRMVEAWSDRIFGSGSGNLDLKDLKLAEMVMANSLVKRAIEAKEIPQCLTLDDRLVASLYVANHYCPDMDPVAIGPGGVGVYVVSLRALRASKKESITANDEDETCRSTSLR